MNLVIQDDVLGSTAASSFGGFRGGTAANLRKALFVQHLGLEKEKLDEGFDNLKKDGEGIVPFSLRPRQTPACAARTGKVFCGNTHSRIAVSYIHAQFATLNAHDLHTNMIKYA